MMKCLSCLFIFGVVTCIACNYKTAAVSGTFAQTDSTKSQLIDRSPEHLLSYFREVIRDKRVIVGQQCSETPDMHHNYKKAFQAVYDSTGKYPALIGLEYGYFDQIDFASTNRYAIDHWNKGGLVTISWHADNPFTPGFNVRWNSARNKDSIHLQSLIRSAPASRAKTNYRTELASVAIALKELQAAGITVLWRPFHEVTGTWFWWGVNHPSTPINQKDYQALWVDMFETFTQEYHLNNLLWVYSPNVPRGAAPVAAMYPGDAYVDIVGMDNYPDEPEFNDYESLLPFNKPVVNGEIGPSKKGFGKFDQLKVINAFKGKAAYFLQWHSWDNAKVSITDNLNFREMMNDPAAITLDNIRGKL